MRFLRFSRWAGSSTTQARGFGFTLLEMLVVVLIMTTALGLFLGYNYRQRDTILLRTTARDVYQWMRASRGYAILEGRENVAVYRVEEHLLVEGLRQAEVRLPETVVVVLEPDDSREVVPVALFYPDGSAERSRILLRLEAHEVLLDVDPVLGEVELHW